VARHNSADLLIALGILILVTMRYPREYVRYHDSRLNKSASLMIICDNPGDTTTKSQNIMDHKSRTWEQDDSQNFEN
jgi:hypothetical protein